ncbi:hypothetical protein H5410_064455 [Solanum commersonii]|uniref:Uncharacterized protein n=1 Tax=Solanum commersonii TaxID=4109 RepID=A0A9J5VZB1_SOLCO|nr:hypothetical protein H5410_064455 [Solanum commersonii]
MGTKAIQSEWRPRSPQNKENRDQGSQQAARTGMTHIISTHNIYKDLDMQEQPTTGKDGEDTNEQREERRSSKITNPRKDSPSTNHHSTKHIQKDQDAVSQNRRPTEVPHIQSTGKENQSAEISPREAVLAGTTGKHITGIPQEKEGIIVQTPQHSKVPGEPPDKPPNNKSQARLSKKRRDAIKKRQLKESDPDKEQQRQNDVEEEFDEYGVNNSEDEYDQDTQSIDVDEDEEEEISNQLIKAFGSTFHTEYQEEVQEVTGKQGLSPRGRKETRQTTKSNSTSATMSRPNTRAKSRDSSQLNSSGLDLIWTRLTVIPMLKSAFTGEVGL